MGEEIRDPVPQFVISMQGEIFGEDTEENREIVRRIHACVNACEGIPTEELEAGIIRDMRSAIKNVIPLLPRNPADAQGPEAGSGEVENDIAENRAG